MDPVSCCIQNILNLKLCLYRKDLFSYSFFMSLLSLISLHRFSFSHFCLLSFRSSLLLSLPPLSRCAGFLICLRAVLIYVSITFTYLALSLSSMPLSLSLSLFSSFSNAFGRLNIYICTNGKKWNLFLTLIQKRTFRNK